MSQPSAAGQGDPAGRTSPGSLPPQSEPGWVRPALIFLLGLLMGTLVIAGSRPLVSTGTPRTGPPGNSSANHNCDLVIADSQHLADLAARASDAAQRQDTTSLNRLIQELNDSESTLDRDAPGCHR